MQVHALYRYPVKSLGGASVTECEPEARGFRDDRRWMFVDADGKFITQRSNPRLARFRAVLRGERGLAIEEVAGGRTLIALTDARPDRTPDRRVTVWDDTFAATEVQHPELATAATALGLPGAQLVYMNAAVRRPVDARYAREGEEVSFADGYPYLITTTASLEDLSERTGEPLEVRRFRPNLVVRTAEPFVEDGWTALTVGAHHFVLPKPCARCIMVTHAPETGARNPRVLAELAAYRKRGNKVLFGQNALWRAGEGPIRVGDAIRPVRS